MAPMNEFSLLRKIEMDIDRKGFHLIVIKGPNSEFLYSHSIGLYKLGQPELVFMNSSIEQADTLLRTLVEQAQDLPEIEPSMMLRIGKSVFSTTPVNPSITKTLLKHTELIKGAEQIACINRIQSGFKRLN